MDTLTISAEPIDGYFESCYAAFLRGDPRPELPPEIEDALDSEARGRIDEVVERLRRRAEARRGRRKRRGEPKAAAGPSPGGGRRSPATTSRACWARADSAACTGRSAVAISASRSP